MKWTMFMLDTAECDNTSENVVLCNTLNGAVITMKRDLYEYSRSLRNAQLQEYYQRNNAENDYTNLCDSDFLIAESKDEKKISWKCLIPNGLMMKELIYIFYQQADAILNVRTAIRME